MRPLRGGTAATFASAIASRHGAVGWRPARAALLLLRPRLPSARLRPIGPRSIHHRWSVRLNLGLRQVRLAAGRVAGWESPAPAVGSLPARMDWVGPRRWVKAAPPLDREARSRQRLPLMLSAPSDRVPAPVALVVRHRSADQGPSATASPPAAAAPRVREQPAPGLAVLPAGELDRVAEHVLRSLDRRVSAWRERRGKV